ncbi:O-methyltransferase [Enterobacter asburiae]|uniref:O-methyltransferase n=1 Tax=unclassified Scandinavium TaxID=2830652 RepID=UPI0028967BC6|nr:O-methyltransferase [Scandinavium sp.]
MNNTLTTAPLAPLLTRLFAQADEANLAENVEWSDEEVTRLMHSKTEYAAFYGQLKTLWLPVSRETGKLLYMLARSCQARQIVEFGTSFGISTLHLAAALRDNGGGQLISSEFEPSKVLRAREHIAEAGLSDLVDIREGDALQTLSRDLPAQIDLLLLDGAKALYPEILARVESRLRPGALLIADDADHSPEYVAWVRNPANGYLSMPFNDDVEISVRLG